VASKQENLLREYNIFNTAKCLQKTSINIYTIIFTHIRLAARLISNLTTYRSRYGTFPSKSTVKPNACIQFASSISSRLLIGKVKVSPHSAKLKIHVANR